MLISHSTLNQRIYRKILTINFNKSLHLLHHRPQFTSSFHDITKKSSSQVPTTPSSAIETPTSSVPPLPIEAGPSEKRRKTVGPSYDASWWHFYE
jgi:hypothetical protein